MRVPSGKGVHSSCCLPRFGIVTVDLNKRWESKSHDLSDHDLLQREIRELRAQKNSQSVGKKNLMGDKFARVNTHTLSSNRELFGAGGGPSGIKSALLTAGVISQPSPSYDLDFQERRCARAFADHASVTGSDYTDGSGAQSLTEYCDSPVLCLRVLQPKHTYVPTATLRIELKAGALENQQLLVWCVHSRVFEATWPSDNATQPNSVVVEELIP